MCRYYENSLSYAEDASDRESPGSYIFDNDEVEERDDEDESESDQDERTRRPRANESKYSYRASPVLD